MSRFNKIIILAVVFLVILLGCKSKQAPEHPNDIPVNNLNTSIQLFAPKNWNNFKINKPVSMQVINISNKDIEFDADLGKEFFLFQDGRLVKIEDTMQHVGATIISPDATLVINDGIISPGEGIGFSFNVLLKNKVSVVRIYVNGKYKDTKESVGGYLDIKLTP